MSKQWRFLIQTNLCKGLYSAEYGNRCPHFRDILDHPNDHLRLPCIFSGMLQVLWFLVDILLLGTDLCFMIKSFIIVIWPIHIAAMVYSLTSFLKTVQFLAWRYIKWNFHKKPRFFVRSFLPRRYCSKIKTNVLCLAMVSGNLTQFFINTLY